AYHDPHRSSHIFDVTQGSNGGCGPVLRHARPGRDGPSGLGTPDRDPALARGPQGRAAGKGSQAPPGRPAAPPPGPATRPARGVCAGPTGPSGDSALTWPVGRYGVAARGFGCAPVAGVGAPVAKAPPTPEKFALPSVLSRNLSGTITDGSGHAWPLYAKIT